MHHSQDPQANGQNVANHAGQYYDSALQQWVNPNAGLTKAYTNATVEGLQPQFNRMDQDLAAKEAAMGITNSGAAKADFSQLGTDQASILAQAIAPIYSQAQGIAGGLTQGKAGAQSSGYANQYGQSNAENFQESQAWQQAMNQALTDAGQAAAYGGG